MLLSISSLVVGIIVVMVVSSLVLLCHIKQLIRVEAYLAPSTLRSLCCTWCRCKSTSNLGKAVAPHVV